MPLPIFPWEFFPSFHKLPQPTKSKTFKGIAFGFLIFSGKPPSITLEEAVSVRIFSREGRGCFEMTLDQCSSGSLLKESEIFLALDPIVTSKFWNVPRVSDCGGRNVRPMLWDSWSLPCRFWVEPDCVLVVTKPKSIPEWCSAHQAKVG